MRFYRLDGNSSSIFMHRMHTLSKLTLCRSTLTAGTVSLCFTMYDNDDIMNQAYSKYKHSLTFRVPRCCHSIETRAPIANPPNSAQLEGTPYHSPKLHPDPCCSVGMRRGTDRHTDRHTDGRDHYTSVVAIRSPFCRSSSAKCFLFGHHFLSKIAIIRTFS